MPRASRLALLAVLGTPALLIAFLVHRALFSPSIPFLPAREGAEWILYPSVPQTTARPAARYETVFQREISLESEPGEAELLLLAFRRASVSINAEPVPIPAEAPRSWKEPLLLDVADHLQPGKNEIVVTVENHGAPPALWLRLSGPEVELASDASWSSSLLGAVGRPARTAREPMSRWKDWGSAARQRIGPLQALATSWPVVLALVAPSLLGVLGWRRWMRRSSSEPTGLTRNQCAALIGGIALFWIALWINNAPLLYRVSGFDAIGHLEYVRYVAEEGRLPLASDGWEMYQPPLYYLLAAKCASIAGLKPDSDAGASLIRWIALAAGVLQCAAVLLCLRAIFPGSARAQLFGTIFAACLPAHLYVAQYITNEALAGALVSISVCGALALMRRREAGLAAWFGVGVLCGLALLAKFSSLVALPVVLATLLARGWSNSGRPRALALRALALLVGVLATSGWHYARVWKAYGKPIVGNWDSESGFRWWQDPGYHEAAYFARFGESLRAPVFAAFHSYGDALYSTLWGDGLLGGSGSPDLFPPWNRGLMAIGFLLALLPTLALLVGAFHACRELVRAPRAEWFLVLGLGGAVFFAVTYMVLKLPYYAQARSIYGLSSLLPLCALCALGMDHLARWLDRARWAPLRAIAPVGFALWAVTSAASLWALDSAENHAAYGYAASVDERHELAESRFDLALSKDPTCVEALRGRVALESARGNFELALEVAEAALAVEPDNGDLHELIGIVHFRRGELDPAVGAVRKAIALQPDHPTAHANHGLFLERAGRDEEAVLAYREALRVMPDNSNVHASLAQVYERLGQAEKSRAQRRFLGLVQPAG